MQDKKKAKLVIKGNGFNTPVFFEIDGELYELSCTTAIKITQNADDYMRVQITAVPLAMGDGESNEIYLNFTMTPKDKEHILKITEKK